MLDVRVILYTDGGARPNPGKIGAGCHGYLIELNSEEKPMKIAGQMITEYGYFERDGNKLKNLKEVRPLQFFDFSFSYDFDATNNVAEILAIHDSINALINKGVKFNQLLIKSDSKIALGLYETFMKSVKEMKAMYERSSLDRIYLDKVRDTIDTLKELGIKAKFEWVKGHSTNFGNNIADTYATIGLFNNESTTTFSDNKKYFDPPKLGNDLVTGKFIFGETYRDNVPGKYFLVNVKVDTHIGRVDPDRLGYSLYYGNPVPEIDTLRNQLDGLDNRHLPYVIRLKNFEDKRNRRIFKLLGDKVLRTLHSNRGKLIVIGDMERGIEHDKDSTIIANTIEPVGLTNEARNLFQLAEMCEEAIQAGADNIFNRYDITDLVYNSTKGKGLKEVRAVSQGSRYVDYKVKGEFEAKVRLHFNRCMPSVNQFNKVKPGQEHKVELFVMFSKYKGDYVTRTQIGDEVLYTMVSGNTIYNMKDFKENTKR